MAFNSCPQKPPSNSEFGSFSGVAIGYRYLWFLMQQGSFACGGTTPSATRTMESSPHCTSSPSTKRGACPVYPRVTTHNTRPLSAQGGRSGSCWSQRSGCPLSTCGDWAGRSGSTRLHPASPRPSQDGAPRSAIKPIAPVFLRAACGSGLVIQGCARSEFQLYSSRVERLTAGPGPHRSTSPHI